MIDFNAMLNALLVQVIETHTAPLLQRLNELEAKAPTGVDLLVARINTLEAQLVAFQGEPLTAMIQEHLKSDTFAARVNKRIVEAVDEAMETHLSDYDHDEFLTSESVSTAVEDAVGDVDFDDRINDALSGQRWTLSLA